ncbi:MAG TPA: efflux RND transporter periplasmic adaptor subunit [Vicinamibacterales bacterium]
MKRALIVILLIAAVGAGVGAFYMRRSGPEISVQTAPITRGELIDAVASTGTLQAVVSVTVGSQVSGNISYLGADFNSIVKEGQVIAKLDPILFQAAVSQSTANLANQKAQLAKDQVAYNYLKITFQRNTDLQKRGIITQDALDAAKSAMDQSAAEIELDKAQIAQAEAQLKTAQANLDHTIITSPINGIVTQRSVDVGQTVQSSMTAPQLFIIAADLTKMQVSANIDESDVGRVRPGQDVTFRVDAYPGVDFRGQVAQIRLNPVVVNNVTTYATMINVPNDDLRLKPGMTANLKVQIARRADAMRLPNTALRFRPTSDMFAALNQPVPPEAQFGRGGRGGGRNAGGANGAAPAAGATATTPAPVAAGTAAAPATGAAAGGSTAASGDTGGRGGDPAERQARMLERFKGMSPDEQKQFVARMKERGQDTTEFEKLLPKAPAKSAAAAKNAGDSKFQFVPKYGAAQSGQTIDALFAPVATPDTRGRAWIFVDHQLKAVNIRLGITDGTYTELIGGDVQPPMEVVTGVTGLGSTRTTAGAAGNPLMPNQRGGPGGIPGGGGAPGRGR